MAEEVIKIEQLSRFKDKLLEKCDETYQGKLTAGENITISEDNVISATGGSGGKIYEGIDPIIVDNDNNTISADTVTIEAANGISISNGTISLIYSTIEV